MEFENKVKKTRGEYMKEYMAREIYYKCSCSGHIFKLYNKHSHNKTQKHKAFVNTNKEPVYSKWQIIDGMLSKMDVAEQGTTTTQ